MAEWEQVLVKWVGGIRILKEYLGSMCLAYFGEEIDHEQFQSALNTGIFRYNGLKQKLEKILEDMKATK